MRPELGLTWRPPLEAVSIFLLLFLPGCCMQPPRVESRRREFTARFETEGQGQSPLFEIHQGGVVRATSLWTANSGTPAACNVHFQCPGCGVFPLVSNEQVVAPQTTNVMLSAGGIAPVVCTVTVLD